MAEARVALVCLHGLAASSRWWDGVVDGLRMSGPVELLDLPRALAPGELANWVAGRLEERAAPSDLVGHSLGALVALRVAVSRPDLVRRLVLIAPAGGERDRSVLGYGWPLLMTLVQSRPRFLVRLTSDMLRAGPRNLVRGLVHVAASDVTPELPLVRVPTLLVWGARDRLVPSSTARLWQEAMPGAELLVLAGVGHVPMFEAPKELVVGITAFRKKVVDQPGDPVRV